MKHFEVETVKLNRKTLEWEINRFEFWTLKQAGRWIRKNPMAGAVRINYVIMDPVRPLQFRRFMMYVNGAAGLWLTPVEGNGNVKALNLRTGQAVTRKVDAS